MERYTDAMIASTTLVAVKTVKLFPAPRTVSLNRLHSIKTNSSLVTTDTMCQLTPHLRLNILRLVKGDQINNFTVRLQDGIADEQFPKSVS